MERPPKILVIDDEEAARYGIVRALSSQGYEIQEASDGDQALETIQQFQPDVVLSDINMPAMDGLSLLKHLQAQAKDEAEVPLVVLITAYGSEEVAVKALRLGAYNYISKPFEIADLRVIIRNAVDKQRLLRENRRYLSRLQQTLAGSSGFLVGGQRVAGSSILPTRRRPQSHRSPKGGQEIPKYPTRQSGRGQLVKGIRH